MGVHGDSKHVPNISSLTFLMAVPTAQVGVRALLAPQSGAQGMPSVGTSQKKVLTPVMIPLKMSQSKGCTCLQRPERGDPAACQDMSSPAIPSGRS